MGYHKFTRAIAKYLKIKCTEVNELTVDGMKRLWLEKRLPYAEVNIVDRKTKKATLLFTLGQPPQDQAKRRRSKARPKSKRAVRLTW